MIGYLIEQELGNVLPHDLPMATVLTQVEVRPDDPAFEHPTKPIGPVYDREAAEAVGAELGWAFAPDGDGMRRVVASPLPQRIFEIRPIALLLDAGTLVVCAGGGGIPTMFDDEGRLHGVEAVIDKDLCAALLAEELGADLLLIATDVDGVYAGWGGPDARRLTRVAPDDLDPTTFSAGSMAPKVAAAARFVRRTGRSAVIGSLDDVDALVRADGSSGTAVLPG